MVYGDRQANRQKSKSRDRIINTDDSHTIQSVLMALGVIWSVPFNNLGPNTPPHVRLYKYQEAHRGNVTMSDPVLSGLYTEFYDSSDVYTDGSGIFPSDKFMKMPLAHASHFSIGVYEDSEVPSNISYSVRGMIDEIMTIEEALMKTIDLDFLPWRKYEFCYYLIHTPMRMIIAI